MLDGPIWNFCQNRRWNMAARPHRPIPELTDRQIDRFLSHIQIGEPDECWPWIGARLKTGYGVSGINQVPHLASRISVRISTGKDPGELVVMHTCNNPPCVNPRHLVPGTQSENMFHRTASSTPDQPRWACGAQLPNAKLSDSAVKRAHFLRASGLTQRQIGDILGVHNTRISALLSGKAWKHVVVDREAFFSQ